MTTLDKRIDEWVGQNRSRITNLVRDLVRLPSENRPPVGSERPAQEHLARWLRKQGMRSEIYPIDQVDGLDEHPLRRAEIDLRDRPNLLLHLPGAEPDEGNSLLISGHMDTVPRGEGAWKHEPFGGEIEGNRLYGRGAYDMKAGVAANFVTAVMLRELGVRLRGDLYVESVVDEEFAGGHGTLAGRLHGPVVDAVVITEPSELAVYRAHRGLRIVRLTLHGKGGVTFSGEQPDPPVLRLPRLIDALVEFGERRNREVRPASAYAGNPNVVNYMITKVRANTWRDDAVLAVPEEVDVEFFWEAQPGEKRAAIEKEFEEFLEGLGLEVDFTYSLRWMSGFETPANHGFVRCFEKNATATLGEAIRAGGAPFPCDLFLCGEFGIDAGIMFGPRGGGAHGPDEWVDLDSLMDVVRTLGRVVVDWCGSRE